MHLANCKDFFPIETVSPAADHDNKPSKKKISMYNKKKKRLKGHLHIKLHFNICIYTYTHFNFRDMIEKAREGREFKENIQYST